MIYATHQHRDGEIEQDATIYKFKTIEKAHAWLLDVWVSDDNAANVLDVTIVEGIYGDCWIKTHVHPVVADPILAPFSYRQMTIQRPGSHPGGKSWWITPGVPVLVAVEKTA